MLPYGLSDFKDIKLNEFKEQLQRYSIKNSELGVIVIFSGWEMVYCEKIN